METLPLCRAFCRLVLLISFHPPTVLPMSAFPSGDLCEIFFLSDLASHSPTTVLFLLPANFDNYLWAQLNSLGCRCVARPISEFSPFWEELQVLHSPVKKCQFFPVCCCIRYFLRDLPSPGLRKDAQLLQRDAHIEHIITPLVSQIPLLDKFFFRIHIQQPHLPKGSP